MRTIYPQKSKSKGNGLLKLLLVVVFSGTFFLIIYLFPTRTRNFFYTISLPFWSVREGYISLLSDAGTYFLTKDFLESKVSDLEKEVDGLRLKVIDYDVLLKENQSLKNKFGREESSNRILSRVLSKPPVSPYDTFVVDAGSKNGVNLGNRVYVSDTIIIGVVKKVSRDTSLVELFSNGGTKQNAVLSRTGASFTLLGNGGSNFVLQVPKDVDVVWGDTFIYSNLHPSLMGSVYHIDGNTQSAFKSVYIRPPTNIFSADWVMIES